MFKMERALASREVRIETGDLITTQRQGPCRQERLVPDPNLTRPTAVSELMDFLEVAT